jgi:hypothetical protein
MMDRYDLLIFIGLGFAFGLLLTDRTMRSNDLEMRSNQIGTALRQQRYSYLNN